MAVQMTIWQVWCNTDPSETEDFFGTHDEAHIYARRLDAPTIVERTVELSKEGVCAALKHLPSR